MTYAWPIYFVYSAKRGQAPAFLCDMHKYSKNPQKYQGFAGFLVW